MERKQATDFPPEVLKLFDGYIHGGLSRRDFLALASTFGASTAMAYGMIGLAAPTKAAAQEAKKGGVLKVAMIIKGPKDPRTADWSSEANATWTN